jgi:hypothetical protein
MKGASFYNAYPKIVIRGESNQPSDMVMTHSQSGKGSSFPSSDTNIDAINQKRVYAEVEMIAPSKGKSTMMKAEDWPMDLTLLLSPATSADTMISLKEEDQMELMAISN